ncbi:MAG: DUF2461 domain-containing protein [Bacteroidota bacterium]
MAYFTQAFITFFNGLEANNHKAWFDEHRKTYEREVRDPFKVLVQDMIERIQMEEPDVRVEPKHCTFRINRDLRFSKDKTPYNTWVSAFISREGKSGNYPGFYFRLHANGITTGGGIWQPSLDNLHRIRSEIAYGQEAFQAIITAPAFRKAFKEVQGAKNKVLPAEFRADREQQSLIANKQFYYMADLDAKFITDPKLPDHLMRYYHTGQPMHNFLRQALFMDEA